jgi:monofunctional biosynthetic peptidoglycan transglycosylase
MRMRQTQYGANDTLPRLYRPVPLDSIGDWLERLVLTGEDDAFFQHHGIDFRQLREALGYRRAEFSWSNPRDRAELWRVLSRTQESGLPARGASTITQQLAKNLYLSPSRNPLRKVKEAVIAWRLERALGKDRILELYLNVAELGFNTWGAEAAAQRYFRRGAHRLTQEQAALIAGTLPHPLTSNPGFRPGRTRYRAGMLMRRLNGPVEETMPEDREPMTEEAQQPDSVIGPR